MAGDGPYPSRPPAHRCQYIRSSAILPLGRFAEHRSPRLDPLPCPATPERDLVLGREPGTGREDLAAGEGDLGLVHRNVAPVVEDRLPAPARLAERGLDEHRVVAEHRHQQGHVSLGPALAEGVDEGAAEWRVSADVLAAGAAGSDIGVISMRSNLSLPRGGCTLAGARVGPRSAPVAAQVRCPEGAAALLDAGWRAYRADSLDAAAARFDPAGPLRLARRR